MVADFLTIAFQMTLVTGALGVFAYMGVESYLHREPVIGGRRACKIAPSRQTAHVGRRRRYGRGNPVTVPALRSATPSWSRGLVRR